MHKAQMIRRKHSRLSTTNTSTFRDLLFFEGLSRPLKIVNMKSLNKNGVDTK